jgi:proteasome lid subunit RPN8/RPN11
MPHLRQPGNPPDSLILNTAAMEPIHIPRQLVNQILEQAQASPGAEVCGLIASRDGQPSHCYPIANTDPDPVHRFLLNPKQQIDAMRHMRAQGEELYAIYHSHPETPAFPSATDLEQAAYPDVLYFIISLGTTGTLQMRAFQLKETEIRPVDFEVA